jgi:hypothetical protein
MSVRRVRFGGQIKIILGDLAAIPARTRRLHVNCAEQTGALLAAISFTAGSVSAVHHVAALMLGKEMVRDGSAGSGEAAGVGADKRSVIRDVGDQLHPDYVDRSASGGNLVFVFFRNGKKICESDGQAVAHVHAQHKRTGPLV